MLPEELPKGEYTLCAYTRYMENEGENTFFRKRIVINSVMNKSIRMETKVRGNYLDVRFINPVTGEVQEVRNCQATSPSGGINLQKKDDGYSVKFHESKDRTLLIQAGNYKEFVALDVKPDYDVSFLPEGGNLVAGTFNRVAFKAINSSGQGEAVSGTLRDEQDSILFAFHSIHRGMGTFGFIPQSGKKYVAVCENQSGQSKRFVLPEALERGYGLQVNRVNEKFFVKLLCCGDAPTESLYLLAHQKGWPVMIHPYKQGNMTYAFEVEKFLPGVASFLLVAENGKILNERMVFVRNDLSLQGHVTADKAEHDSREKVSLSVSVKDSNGKDWNGECSVAVTDNYDVQPDSCVNIFSTLLLESGLRGHIESPAWYFQSGNELYREQALDVLMMTQGWKRYDLEKTWQGEFQHPSIPHEASLSIEGKVTKRISRKPVENAVVQLMVPTLGETKKLVTGSDGLFRFDGFEYPDSTIYWVNAYTEKGKDNVVVDLDTIVPPSLAEILPPYREDKKLSKREEVSPEYLAKADLRILHEKGMRHIFLDEVLVTAPKFTSKSEYAKILVSRSINEDRINQSGVTELLPFLRQQHAAISWSETNGELIVLMRGAPVSVIIDGSIYRAFTPESHSILRNFFLRDVAQIDIINSPFSLAYDPFAGGGIVAITTKDGYTNGAKWDPTNLKDIQLLGFQLPTEFYSPRYELTADKEKETPDLRTTIYWQPRLVVKNGKALIEFYTADGAVNYSVVVEGVGEDGSLLRIEESIK